MASYSRLAFIRSWCLWHLRSPVQGSSKQMGSSNEDDCDGEPGDGEMKRKKWSDFFLWSDDTDSGRSSSRSCKAYGRGWDLNLSYFECEWSSVELFRWLGDRWPILLMKHRTFFSCCRLLFSFIHVRLLLLCQLGRSGLARWFTQHSRPHISIIVLLFWI